MRVKYELFIGGHYSGTYNCDEAFRQFNIWRSRGAKNVRLKFRRVAA